MDATQDDLKDLGFPKGPRIKLLHEVQNLSFTPRAWAELERARRRAWLKCTALYGSFRFGSGFNMQRLVTGSTLFLVCCCWFVCILRGGGEGQRLFFFLHPCSRSFYHASTVPDPRSDYWFAAGVLGAEGDAGGRAVSAGDHAGLVWCPHTWLSLPWLSCQRKEEYHERYTTCKNVGDNQALRGLYTAARLTRKSCSIGVGKERGECPPYVACVLHVARAKRARPKTAVVVERHRYSCLVGNCI